MKRKILFIAPASIPIFGAEAIVNVKLLSVLIDAGYVIDLISKKSKWQNYPETDFSLTQKLNSVNIISIDNKVNLKTLYYHFMSLVKFGVVYSGSHWAYKALCFILHEINVSDYDAVITKSYPSELVGYWLKRKKGIKWIATWNDPFPIDCYPSPYGNGFRKQPWYSRKILKIMKEVPDYNVFPSSSLYRYMDSYIGFPSHTVMIIPHVALMDKSFVKKSNGKIKLLVSGNNQWPRNPQYLIEAFIEILSLYNVQTELHFVGMVDDNIRRVIESQVKESIKILPPVSYEKSISLLKEYDVAVIIEADCKEGIFLPTKVVDFMQVGIPVLAISPSVGVLKDLYKNSYIGYFADCTSKKSITDELYKIILDYNNGSLQKTSIPSDFSVDKVLSKYEKMIDA